jgi:hypothetical protein
MAYDLEVQTMRFILDKMRAGKEGNRLLVNTERVYLAKTNLILVEACLEELGERGVYVSIDRPYHYMSHLLRIHKVPHDGLMFIDAVTNISGERKVERDSVNFLETPFAIPRILKDLKVTRRGAEGNMEEIDLLERDFVVIDDVSAIFYYRGVSSGKRFIEDYLGAIGSSARTFTAVAVDREAHRELYEFLSTLTDRGVDMGTASFQLAQEQSSSEDVTDSLEPTSPTRVRG